MVKKELHEPDTDTIRLRRDLDKGDLSFFWQFWEENRAQFLKVCLKHSHWRVDEAEDTLSGVMIKAVEILPKHIDNIINIKSWLIRITNNYCIDLYRKRKKIKIDHVNIQEVYLDGYQPASTNSNTESEFTSNQISAYTKQVFSKIPPNLRDVFIYRFYNDMSYHEISELLNISISSVRKRIQRARDLLKKTIDKELPDSEDIDNTFALNNQGLYKEDFISVPIDVEVKKLKEIEFNSTILHNTQITLNSGIILDTYIPLNKKPVRQKMKEKTLNTYIRRFPNGWKKHLELANLLYSVNRWKEASEMYQEVLKRKKRLINVRIGLGEMYHLMQKEEKSVELYESALPIAHSPGTKHHVKGLIEMEKKNYKEAIQEFKKSIIEESRHEAHRLRLGMVYQEMDQQEKALICFNEVLDINPKNIVALTNGAEILMKTGRPSIALTQAQKILTQDKTNIPALRMLAHDRCRRLLVFQEEGTETRLIIKKMEKQAPKVADVMETLAFYHIARGEWDKGLDLLDNFTKEYKNSPAGWHHYAKWQYRTGRSYDACETILKAWSLYKNDPEIHKTACEILSYAKQWDLLRIVIEDMLSRFDKMWSVWNAAGMAMVHRQDNKIVSDYALKAVTLQSAVPETWFQAGYIFKLMDNMKYAISAFEIGWRRIKERQSTAYAAYAAICLGEYYLEVDDSNRSDSLFNEAGSLITSIEEYNPSFGLYLTGILNESQNNSADALEAYSKALNLCLFYPMRQKAIKAKERIIQLQRE